MKKLVLAALAIGAMAACTKSSVQYEQTGEICLQPVAQKATKAAVDGTVYPTTESFNVWAKWCTESEGKEITNPALVTYTAYINEGTFANIGDKNWAGRPTPYYWPTTGYLVFAGYSPASAKPETPTDGAPEFQYDFPKQEFTVKNYVQSSDIALTNDLMWFDFDGNSYNMNIKSTDGNTVNTGVPVVFKHALSWLTFKFNLENVNTPENWVVTNVKLTGIETKGNFTSKPTDSNPNWTDLITPAEVIVYSGTADSGASITYNSEDPITLENTVNKNGVVVIPQSCASNAANLVVTYNLKNTATNDYLRGQTVTLNLNVGTDGDTWLPGKHYIYTIVFGGNEILISPTVDNWETVTKDIEVQ